MWEQAITLRPRTFALLRYFAGLPGRLVTKAELRQHVWAGTHVTDTVLRVCLREIREALGDVAAAPQYLQTVSGQGYRWLVPGGDSARPLVDSGPIVGRQDDIDALETCFRRAAAGSRQLVISGEAGIGKTTVIDLWLARLAARSEVECRRGQCAAFYGEGEPYLQLLDVLGQLGRGPQGEEILTVLRWYAPMWLVQLPGLVGATELERVQRQVQGVTQTRTVRALADALAVLTADRPLVLVLEDLRGPAPSTPADAAYPGLGVAPPRLDRRRDCAPRRPESSHRAARSPHGDVSRAQTRRDRGDRLLTP